MPSIFKAVDESVMLADDMPTSFYLFIAIACIIRNKMECHGQLMVDGAQTSCYIPQILGLSQGTLAVGKALFEGEMVLM